MSEKYKNVFLMLSSLSIARGDNIGFMPHILNCRRLSEISRILMDGCQARWWLSTRLLLGLSHEEALAMGKELVKFWEVDIKLYNQSLLRVDSLGLTIA